MSKNKINKLIHMKVWVRIIAVILSSLFLAFIFEFVRVNRIESRIQKYGLECASEQITLEEFEKDGIVEKEDVLFSPEGIGTATITFPERYVHKLQYHYVATENFTINIKVKKQNVYGDYEEIVINDMSRMNLNDSFVNIGEVINQITFEIPAGVQVTGIIINNQIDFNTYRFLFSFFFCLALLGVIVLKNDIKGHVEYNFLAIGLAVGAAIILMQPTQFTSWDEHIHFYKTFDLFKQDTVVWDEAENYQYWNWETFDGVPFKSKEEKALQIEYLNSIASRQSQHSYEKGSFALNNLGYIHMSVIVSLAQFLKVPFFYVLMLGKVTNYLLYLTLIFMTIRTIPICKRAVMVVALMPTPIMMATAYAYDIAVIGFVFLGTAYLVREFLTPDRTIKLSTMLKIATCFLLGAFPKAIYIPLVLSAAFLPKTKFKDKKQRYIFYGIIAVACMMLMMSFVLPTVSGSATADSRGGNTNVATQLQLVLSQPLSYARVLWNNVSRTFGSYFLGKDNLANMAYLGYNEHVWVISVFLIFVVATEPRDIPVCNVRGSLNRYKVTNMILICGVVVLIWTAMYLSFTPVNSTNIAGVQGRYYLPLLLPFFVTLYTDKIKVSFRKENYDLFISIVLLWLWNVTIHEKYLLPFCS